MKRSSIQSIVENSWAVELLGHSSLRRNGSIQVEPHLPVPHSVQLTGGFLVFQGQSPVSFARGKQRSSAHLPRKVDSYLWRDFADLADAEPETIRRFAERWGPLRPSFWDKSADSEPLEGWVYLAKLARSLLSCSIAIQQARAGCRDDWQRICRWLKQTYDPLLTNTDPDPKSGDLKFYRRVLVVLALNCWYSASSGNVLLGMRQGKVMIEPATTTLFGIIGLQLAYRITNASEMLACYHCRRFFTPLRKAATGARTFCPSCRRSSKPQLYAMRDYRQRRKQGADGTGGAMR